MLLLSINYELSLKALPISKWTRQLWSCQNEMIRPETYVSRRFSALVARKIVADKDLLNAKTRHSGELPKGKSDGEER